MDVVAIFGQKTSVASTSIKGQNAKIVPHADDERSERKNTQTDNNNHYHTTTPPRNSRTYKYIASTMIKSTVLLSLLALSQGFTISPQTSKISSTSTPLLMAQSDEVESRREFFTASTAALGLVALVAVSPEDALASGGATAGKYT